MIIDSNNITWKPNEDRSTWTASNGGTLIINPSANDEQVLSCVEQLYVRVPVEKTDAERIAELEAQVKALLSRLA